MTLLRELTSHRISPTNLKIRVFAINAQRDVPPEAYLMLKPVEATAPADQVTAGTDGTPMASWSEAGATVDVWVNAAGYWHLRFTPPSGKPEGWVGAPTSLFLKTHGGDAYPALEGMTWDALFAVIYDWFAGAPDVSRNEDIANHVEYARLLMARRVLKGAANAHRVTETTWDM